MSLDTSMIGYFLSASLVVKLVMLTLLSASFFSWVFIFQRGQFLKQTMIQLNEFESQFWSAPHLSEIYQTVQKKENINGLENIFHSGFQEFIRLTKSPHAHADATLAGTQRAMRAAYLNESIELEKHLPFLATVGSTSPYVGLFGTVWGIMASFQSLGHVSQATIAMVAPGISEALIATALGLFAAIPAVIAYNRYSAQIEQLLNRYQVFQDEFLSYLYRQMPNASSK